MLVRIVLSECLLYFVKVYGVFSNLSYIRFQRGIESNQRAYLREKKYRSGLYQVINGLFF